MLYNLVSVSILFPGDGAVPALWLALGACGLWVSVLLSESAPAPPGAGLPAAGAEGHLHRRQTQVGDIYPYITHTKIFSIETAQ